jgi:hypothetical protein
LEMLARVTSKGLGLSTKVWANSNPSKLNWLRTKRTSWRSMSLKDKSAYKMQKSVILKLVRHIEQRLFTMAIRINSQVGIRVSLSLHHTLDRKTTKLTSLRNGCTLGMDMTKECKESSFSLNSVICCWVAVTMVQSKSGMSWLTENVCVPTWATPRPCVIFSSQMTVVAS